MHYFHRNSMTASPYGLTYKCHTRRQGFVRISTNKDVLITNQSTCVSNQYPLVILRVKGFTKITKRVPHLLIRSTPPSSLSPPSWYYPLIEMWEINAWLLEDPENKDKQQTLSLRETMWLESLSRQWHSFTIVVYILQLPLGFPPPYQSVLSLLESLQPQRV